MRVSVKGAENRLLAKWLRIAAIFYANELMHVNLVKNLNVKIILRSPDKNFKDKGSCEWDETDGPPNPRYFTIVLAKGKNKREIFRTLAHEMVHLRQYAKNEMTGLLNFGKKILLLNLKAEMIFVLKQVTVGIDKCYYLK